MGFKFANSAKGFVAFRTREGMAFVFITLSSIILEGAVRCGAILDVGQVFHDLLEPFRLAFLEFIT